MKKRLVAIVLTTMTVMIMMAPLASARMARAPAGPGFGDSVAGGATTTRSGWPTMSAAVVPAQAHLDGSPR